MDRNENGILKENSCNEESSILTSNMFLNNVGEVFLTHNSNGLSWDSTDPVSNMYRFSVHCVQKSKAHHSMRVASVYTFSHKDLHTCQMWIDLINNSLNKNLDKPKSLLVFVNPMSGKEWM
ncbi:hypothetical protein Leryth_009841 [Lithospermum erythrorhizon]|nr:hypothetical protein Leryth_009841 [Lithospermum erythrorhizon]